MSKIVLDEITNTTQVSKINENFTKLETALNDKVLYRDNVIGEPNTLVTDVDVNGVKLYNLPAPILQSQAARLQDVTDAINAVNTAVLTSFAPAGNVAATNVQGAIQELDGEKASLAQLAASSGSSLVGFLQRGSGAVAQTLEEKEQREVSVFDYMTLAEKLDSQLATPLLNTTSAFENAIKAVADNGGIVNIPAGIFNVDINADWSGSRAGDGFPSWTGFTRNKSFTLKGCGGLSVLRARSGGAGYALRIAYPIKIDGTQIHRHNIKLVDFEIDLNGEKKGIQLVQAKSAVVDGINFYNGADGTVFSDAYALGCFETGLIRISNLNIYAPYTYTDSSAIYMNGLGTADFSITGCDIGGYGHGVYYHDGPGDMMLEGNVIYNQGINCLTVNTTARDSSQNRILNNHFGEPSVDMISLSDGYPFAALNTNISHNFFWVSQTKGDGVVLGKSIRTIVADNIFEYVSGGVGALKAAIRIRSTASRWEVHHNIINNLTDTGIGIDVAGIYGEVSHNVLQAASDTAGTYFIALRSATAQRIGVSFNTCHQGGSNMYALYQDGQIGTLRVDMNRFWGGLVTARTDVNRREMDETGVFSSGGFQILASTWNVNPLRLSGYYVWVGATVPNVGKLMIKAGAPTTDNDGTVVGTQT